MSADTHFHPLRVARIDRDGDDAIVVSFDVPPEHAERFRFAPGQYLTLRRGGLRRSYSICAAPGDRLRIGVRRVPGGAFSDALQRELRPGDAIDTMPPQGRFGAALENAPRHVLLVAGGSGITPILSLLQTALAAGVRCTLVYANRSAASAMFAAEIDDLKDRHLQRLAVHCVYSRATVDVPLHAGRLDAAKIAAVLRLAGAVDEAFVCGPHAMNDEVEAALVAAGVPRGRIHVERFGVPPQAPAATRGAQPGDAETARIVVVRDGTTREIGFDADDASLLDAAARAGIDVPYACKSGVCATCRARVTEGRVRMDRNFALEPAEVAAGDVLTCQAHPLTARVTVDYDAR